MYPQVPSTANGVSRLEQIMEMLMSEVQRERELVNAHADARKGLDALLRREQHTVAELQGCVDVLQQQTSELSRMVKERNSEILELIEIAGPNLSLERRRKAETLAAWGAAPDRQNKHVDKEASARGNNPAAPVWVPNASPPLGAAVAEAPVGDLPREDDDAKLKSLLESLRQH